jgi:hypothetical protein
MGGGTTPGTASPFKQGPAPGPQGGLQSRQAVLRQQQADAAERAKRAFRHVQVGGNVQNSGESQQVVAGGSHVCSSQDCTLSR